MSQFFPRTSRRERDGSAQQTMAVDPTADPSDETKRKVDAAKSYIENMYRVQHQNIQERYAR